MIIYISSVCKYIININNTLCLKVIHAITFNVITKTIYVFNSVAIIHLDYTVCV